MDLTTAEALYKQVIQTEASNTSRCRNMPIHSSNMQASEAAAILGNKDRIIWICSFYSKKSG